MDACFLPGSSGMFVAAAGTWAVCLWSQTPASDWSLKHTWTFKEASSSFNDNNNNTFYL